MSIRFGIMSSAYGPRLARVARIILLPALVGVVAGLGAIAFHLLCNVVVHYGLEAISGYHAGGPAGERELFEKFTTPFRPWLLPAVLAVGGLVSGWLVFRFAPEAEGHGTDAAIDAYHNKGGVIRGRVPIIKMLSAAITLGTGGSGGREGPIAQVGAGFGSYLATRLKLGDHERRILLAAGMGAGIGAIFHAPLAGAIFAIEVLYRDTDFEAEALIPAFIATTVAYSVFGWVFGFQTLFAVAPLSFDNPAILVPLAVLAVVMAGASFVYVKSFYGAMGLFKKLPIPRYLHPCIGATLTGLFAVGMFHALADLGPNVQRQSLSVLSFGYGFLQDVLADGGRLAGGTTAVVVLLLAVGLGKIVTTSLTIGSGGSGGVFGPSMVIGGSLGALVGIAFQHLMPQVVTRVDVFVLLGMAGFFAAAANTPVSTLIMVSEMTASYQLLLPSMWVCALAYILSRRWTIYREQVSSRIDSPAHREDLIVDVLAGMTVRDVWQAPSENICCFALDDPLSDIVRRMTTTDQCSFPVLDTTGRYYGLFGLKDVRQFLYDSHAHELALAQDLAEPGVTPLTLDTDLSGVMTEFARLSYEELPVVANEGSGRVLGLLRRRDVIAAYNVRVMVERGGRK